jgi:GNAT superfamily N-acetyltransferase
MIRTRTVADEPRCLALLREVRASDGYPVHLADATRFLQPPSELRAWVATVQDRIVGHVALHHDPRSTALAATCAATGLAPDDVVTVSRLFVAASVRRTGVARKLLARATREAHAMRRQPILDVVASSRGAIALYEREGWTRVGELTWHFPELPSVDAWLYLGPAP